MSSAKRDESAFKRVGTLSLHGDNFATSTPVFRCPTCAALVAHDDDGLAVHAKWHDGLEQVQRKANQPWDPRLTPGWDGSR